MVYDYFRINNNFKKYNHIKSNLVVGEKSNHQPFFSILIPTYKRFQLLEEAIDSAINQDFPLFNYEIIIVDNDPHPNSKIFDLILCKKQKNLFYYKNEQNIGMVGNWNRCIELARGKWITFLHDDDLFFPDFLLNLNLAINELPHVTLFAPTPIIKHKNSKINFVKNNEKRYFIIKPKDFIFINYIPTQGTTFKREKCLQLGGYSEELYPGGPDNIFHIKYLLYNQGVSLRDVKYIYRIEDNETFKNDTLVKGLINQYIIKFKLSERFITLQTFVKPIILNELIKNLNNTISQNKLTIELEPFLASHSISMNFKYGLFTFFRRVVVFAFIKYKQIITKTY